jgi:hypoxanthine phosphoribosyltransferase
MKAVTEAVDGWRVGRVLFSAEAIAQRVGELADTISAAYGGQELTLVSVLKGSFMFLADLSRRLSLPARVDFLGVSSYDGTEASGRLRVTTNLTSPITDRHTLVVEDIVDTGRTLAYALARLRRESPASLRLCTLFDKPSRRRVPVAVDFVGFTIPDCFVVGYGLDVDGWFRHLPYVAVLERDPSATGD